MSLKYEPASDLFISFEPCHGRGQCLQVCRPPSQFMHTSMSFNCEPASDLLAAPPPTHSSSLEPCHGRGSNPATVADSASRCVSLLPRFTFPTYLCSLLFRSTADLSVGGYVLNDVSSSLLGPVDPSFRALSGRLKLTVRRHTFNTDSPLNDPTTEFVLVCA